MDVDIVVVCAPTGRHGEVAIEALDAGKHVIVEKPAEITVAKVDEIIEAQQKAGTLVTVISQHRFDPATETVLAAIQRGELGRLTSGIASIDWWRGQSYYDSGDWRGTWELDGGGALMNQGVHTVDLLSPRWAARSRSSPTPARSRTSASRWRTSPSAWCGSRAAPWACCTRPRPPTRALSARVQVHGDRGSAVIDNDQLVFFHGTPAGEDPEERSYGHDVRPDAGADAGATAASNPAGLGPTRTGCST